MVDDIQNIYDLFDQMHLSTEMLLIFGGILFISMLFAMREAAAWFFKVHDLKKNIRDLQESLNHLQTQISSLESRSSEAPPRFESPNQSKAKKTSFPIHH